MHYFISDPREDDGPQQAQRLGHMHQAAKVCADALRAHDTDGVAISMDSTRAELAVHLRQSASLVSKSEVASVLERARDALTRALALLRTP